MLANLQWYEKFTDVDEVIPVSAKYGHGVDDVKDWILSKLPLGPAFYPKVCMICSLTLFRALVRCFLLSFLSLKSLLFF